MIKFMKLWFMKLWLEGDLGIHVISAHMLLCFSALSSTVLNCTIDTSSSVNLSFFFTFLP